MEFKFRKIPVSLNRILLINTRIIDGRDRQNYPSGCDTIKKHFFNHLKMLLFGFGKRIQWKKILTTAL
jgi:hypothetical protein